MKFNPGARKMLEEAVNAVSSNLRSSDDFPNLVAEVPMISDKVVAGDMPLIARALT